MRAPRSVLPQTINSSPVHTENAARSEIGAGARIRQVPATGSNAAPSPKYGGSRKPPSQPPQIKSSRPVHANAAPERPASGEEGSGPHRRVAASNAKPSASGSSFEPTYSYPPQTISSEPVQAVAAPLRTSGGAGSSDHPSGSSAARSTGGSIAGRGGGGATSGCERSHANSAAATNTANATAAVTSRCRSGLQAVSERLASGRSSAARRLASPHRSGVPSSSDSAKRFSRSGFISVLQQVPQT